MSNVEPFKRYNDSGSGVSESIAALRAAIAPIGAGTLIGVASAAQDVPQRMGIRVGDLYMLIPSSGGREVIAPPPISRIPNTASWLRGLANVRGNLIPVIELAEALDMVATRPVRPYLLISGEGDKAMGLLIDALPRLVNFAADEQPLAQPLLPALLEPAVIAAYEREGRVWFDVDLNVLFETIARRIAL